MLVCGVGQGSHISKSLCIVEWIPISHDRIGLGQGVFLCC